ncbi:putative oxidoreductase GLYR1-like protein [Trichonephila inaurata madagascariensis]|uniref:Putative oxidoreductase GLYR1-like protein n=1 Tax=Trichonephila inaurata madagascariensis TaxID=2747483 RepID=A0A8X6XF16_9ARAC|nr:putative oxidoreductase GLYR1-like protein [Trichonephila inaurata madagascariensis]
MKCSSKVPKSNASFSKQYEEIIDISDPLPTSLKGGFCSELTNHFSDVQRDQSTTTHLIRRSIWLRVISSANIPSMPPRAIESSAYCKNIHGSTQRLSETQNVYWDTWVYLEAPIIGSILLAEKSSLSILAAGDHDIFARCSSCFSAISKYRCYLSSDVGEASKLALIQSMLIGTACVGLAETMSFAERLNLSKKSFLNYLKLSDIACPLYAEKAQAMVTNNFSTDISLSISNSI